MIDYAKLSLEGVWVGDCVGNLGQLYFAHDILKALSEGVAKFGGQLSQYHNQFVYSDDTEEAIVLYNHVRNLVYRIGHTPIINQDMFAKELATRYMTRDPDHEVFVCESVNFVSEWRIYVHEHEIVGIKPYFTKEDWDYQLTPFYPEVKRMIDAYKPSAPIAYGLDVGIILREPRGDRDKLPSHVNALTSLVEINDGICLGNYGLDPMHYAEMIAARWLELTTKGKV